MDKCINIEYLFSSLKHSTFLIVSGGGDAPFTVLACTSSICKREIVQFNNPNHKFLSRRTCGH